METTVETLEENRATIHVVLDATDVDAAIKAAYKDFAYRYNFPGFRKGKAPRPIIDNMLGKEAARAAATDTLVNENYPRALDESGLYPMGKPTVNAEELVENAKPYEFTIDLDTIPQPELSSYDAVEIELPPEKVTEEEIDAQIDSFREQLADLEDCPADTEIQSDSVVELSIRAVDDEGEEVASFTSEASLYPIGSGMLPAIFDEKLLGLRKDDTVSFSLDTADEPNIRVKAFASKTSKIDFDVTVTAIKKRVLPEVTEEWAKENNFESVADLRTRVSDGLQSQKDAARPALKERACLTKLAQRLDVDLPEALCEEQEATLLQNFFQQLQSQGLSFDLYLSLNNLSSDQFKEDIKKQAADVVRQDLALDAWARHNNYEVSDQDMAAEFDKAAATDDSVDAKELEAQWRDSGRMHLLRQGILRARAAEALMEGAVVSEKVPGSDDEEAKASDTAASADDEADAADNSADEKSED